MVRDPSIVSPSLTGVFIGGGHNKHGTGSRCTLPKQCRPPSPRRRWRCDRSSYKRSLFSRIRDSQMHYLTGPETTETHPSPSRIHVGSNHSGMGKPINFRLSRVFCLGRGFSCGVVRARGSSLRILPTYISYPFYQRRVKVGYYTN